MKRNEPLRAPAPPGLFCVGSWQAGALRVGLGFATLWGHVTREGKAMPGKLLVVGTPIGNLGDMTPRALVALEAADAVLAEDTRVTGKLLHALGFEARL